MISRWGRQRGAVVAAADEEALEAVRTWKLLAGTGQSLAGPATTMGWCLMSLTAAGDVGVAAGVLVKRPENGPEIARDAQTPHAAVGMMTGNGPG